MSFAPWSLAYILPLFAYVCSIVLGRRTWLDPLLIGGTLLAVVFLLHEPYQQAFPTSVLALLHLLASGAYWIGGLMAHRQARIWHQSRSDGAVFMLRRHAWAHLSIGVVAMAGFIFLVMYKGSFELMLYMRNRPELQLGSVVSEVTSLERLAVYLHGYLGTAAVFAVFFWARRIDTRPLRIALLAVSLGAAAAILAAAGSRGSVLYLAVRCLFAAHFAFRGSPAARVFTKLVAAAAVPLLLATVCIQTLYRSTGLATEEGLPAIRQRAVEALTAIVSHVSFNDEVQFVLANYPNTYGYTYGHSLVTPFVVFVPRSAWPDKPVPWGRDLAWQYGYRYDTTVSLAATVQGEGYANLGLAGWTLMPLVFGSFIGWTFHYLKNSRDEFELLFGLWGLFWALSLRGDLHSAIAASIFPSLVLIVCLRFLAFRKVAPPQACGMLPDVVPAIAHGY